MDGVLVREEHALPGAAEFLQRLVERERPFLVLTNNSIFTPRDLSARLLRSGLSVPEGSIWTSALATAAFLNDQLPGGSAYVIGEAGLTTPLHEVGYTLTDTDPDFVVLGETRTYSFTAITKAIRLIIGGARFIATNPDVTGPSAEGPMPATGSVAAMITKATGREPYFVGKPNPMMFRSALNRIEAHSESTMMVGDRMDTDVVAGIEAGLDTSWCSPDRRRSRTSSGIRSGPGRCWTPSPTASTSCDRVELPSKCPRHTACDEGPRHPVAALPQGADPQRHRGRRGTAAREHPRSGGVRPWDLPALQRRATTLGQVCSARAVSVDENVLVAELLPGGERLLFRGVDDSWVLVRFADGADTTLRPETIRRVELHGRGPESVLTALGVVKPDDVELECLSEDLGQGETETRHRYQWTEAGRSILAEKVKNEIFDGATPYSTYVRGLIIDGDGGVVLNGRDDSATLTEG